MGRSAFALMTSFALLVSPVLTGVGWAAAPTAEISGPSSGSVGETLDFDGSGSTDDGSIVQYEWDFGDGGSDSGESVSYSFSTAGNYTVTLTVTDDEDLQATDSLPITIDDPPPPNQDPVADPGGPYSGDTGQTITFDGSGSTDDGSIVSYEWDFGDGNSGSGESPTHSYASANSYTVTLTVTDNDGGSDSDSTTATIDDPPPPNQDPVADANGPYSGDTGENISFSSAGSNDPDGTIAAYLWSFGDGNTSTSPNPTHSYSTAGTKTVTLTVTDNDGGSDSDSTTATIDDPPPPNQDPVADANGPYSGDTGENISFSSAGSNDPDGTIAAYLWSFGDGNTSTSPNPTHSYSTAGTKTVTLTVTDNDGGSDSDSTTATIDDPPPPNQDPVADANGPYSGDTGENISFSSAGSNDPDGTIAAYLWSFGDGNTSTSPNPTHSYSTAGTKTVTLTVTDNDGGSDSDSTTATIDDPPPPNQDPVADANGPYSGDTGENISFSSAGSNDPDGTIAAYLWSFGDGNTSTSPNPTHSYSTAGTKTVTLTVTDNDGGSDSDSTTATIDDPPPPNQDPVADANGPYSGDTGENISFSSAGSNDPDGTIAAYLWSFGDGNTSTSPNPTHSYPAAGSYTVTLRVTDNDGASNTDSTSAAITVPNQAPVADANGPYSGDTGENISFSSAGSNDPDGTIATYLWSFGDGNTSTSPNPTHSYPAAGSYTVTLRVTDNDGASNTDSTSAAITVPNQPPTADANGPYSGDTGENISFSSAGSNDPDGTIATYLWSFGDGNTSTSPNPTHSYGAAGTYTATLTVTDNDGASDTVTAEVTMNETPSAEAGGPYTSTQGDTIRFDGSGSTDDDGSIETYEWDWGDGTPGGSSVTAGHSYSSSGTYTVTLTVTDNDGASASDTAEVTIKSDREPSVAITTPGSGAQISGPLTVRIEADDSESATRSLDVDYRIDTGTWQPASYNTFTQRFEDTIDTTTLTNGQHSVVARATDSFGNIATSSSVTFTISNNETPTVNITTPAANSLVSGSTTITAAAADDTAVSSVEFFVDGASIGTDTSSAGGWSITWDTSGTTGGRHTLTATATDGSGSTADSPAVSVIVDQEPVVDITSPRSLAVVEERIIIRASATDDIGISQVQFFVDGTSIGTDITSAGGWAVSWDSRDVNNGRRTIRAVATDSNSQTTSDSIVVTVDNDLAPSITITGPRDGATIFAVGVVVIGASATDREGVEQVEFFVDGTSLGVDTRGNDGWSAVWNPIRATIGSHDIRAVATDTIGQTSADENRVTVQAFTSSTTTPEGTVSALEVPTDTPAQGLAARAFSVSPSTVSSGGEIALSVTMAASIPGRADVQFLLDGQPLGEQATVAAARSSDGAGVAAVFTRTLPVGMQTGLHRVELVTADEPPRVLASRTFGVVAGSVSASGEPVPAPSAQSTNAGLVVAIVIGSVSAAAAAGFGAAGWYRRKLIVRRLATRSW